MHRSLMRVFGLYMLIGWNATGNRNLYRKNSFTIG